MTTTDASPTAPDTRGASSRRAAVMSFTGLGASVLIAGLTVLPAPYAIGGAGPTFDTLGEVDGEPIVAIEGAPTYDASGELRLTTVSVSAAGRQPFTLGRVLVGWASERNYVVPQEEVFGTPEEEALVEEQAAQAWISSQDQATVAALDTLGIDVPATITVVQVSSDSNAEGLLEEDDVLVAIDGVDITTLPGLTEAVRDRAPGDDIEVTVDRDGERVTETFATIDGGNGVPLMGIVITPDYELPIDLTVAIDDVSGPSGGLMFALGIIDRLTPEDELAGALVAGTGTINEAGDVGAIGGVRMKLWGAVDAGAEWFLAPASNCSEVTGNVPDGLTVVAVDTLDEAYDAITRIGVGETTGFPSC
ncbi:YlbL family protein [Demequina pelophila]|uniref:YlbL family protein n=1 Tax=Demequina pelophila TaxID=1638984 RepID=UPI00078430F8|nr:PDZ domain-containing protein [Demequina pelophila]